MDKKTIIFVIAQNGLGTAEGLLAAEIKVLEKKLATESAGPRRDQFEKDLKGKTNLKNALHAADVGIAEYLNPTE